MSHQKDDLEALVARVERLEAQNRRRKLASTLLLLFGVSLAVLGAKPAEPSVVRASAVEAQEFILKDAEGHVHAREAVERLTAQPTEARTETEQNQPEAHARAVSA